MAINFIQTQPFKLSGSGSSIGDTTLTLQSMVGIDGNNIVTADLGTTCYGTLEPGNGVQEEAFSFTGVTQNANGTATLTGVSHVMFKQPYTATSGLQTTHAGASTVILSNDAAFYFNLAQYINTVAASGAAPASNIVEGITFLSVAPTGNPVALGVNDSRVMTALQSSYVTGVAIPTGTYYGVDTTGASAYTVALPATFTALASGVTLRFQAKTGNAGPVTLNVNSLGAKSLDKNYNVALASGDVVAGQIVEVAYDGTNFQMQTPPSVTLRYSNGTTSHNLATASPNIIPHGLSLVPTKVNLTGVTQGPYISIGTYDSTGQNNVNTSTTTGVNEDVYGIDYADNSGNSAKGTVTVDATNITISWLKGGTPTGSMQILWQASV